MPKHSNDRLQGTLDLLLLTSLAFRGSMHGYGITIHIQQISEEALRIEEGSLYPALHLNDAGWMAESGMGSFRKQSSGSILCDYRHRA
jgi:PadR family transcriptional regulator PadR